MLIPKTWLQCVFTYITKWRVFLQDILQLTGVDNYLQIIESKTFLSSLLSFHEIIFLFFLSTTTSSKDTNCQVYSGENQSGWFGLTYDCTIFLCFECFAYKNNYDGLKQWAGHFLMWQLSRVKTSRRFHKPPLTSVRKEIQSSSFGKKTASYCWSQEETLSWSSTHCSLWRRWCFSRRDLEASAAQRDKKPGGDHCVCALSRCLVEAAGGFKSHQPEPGLIEHSQEEMAIRAVCEWWRWCGRCLAQ